MRLRPLLVGVAVVLLALAVLVHREREHRLARERASWALTPGSLNPAVTSATIQSTICRRGWTQTIRPPSSYTSALKLVQLRTYGFPGGPRSFEEDHLISLELGGSPTDPHNLWPESRPRADDVDRIENELNAKVCAGSLALSDAQRQLSEIKHTGG